MRNFLCEMWLLILVAVSVVVAVDAAYESVYDLMQLAYANESLQYSVTNESQCSSACAGNTAAVAYSELLKLCYKTQCPRIKMTPSAFWKVFICGMCLRTLLTNNKTTLINRLH